MPGFRGKHTSRKIEDIVEEAKNLAKKGVKELILISQELTFYGLDLYKKRAITTLLDNLVEIDGIEWIRLHYTYPGNFPYELIETMAKYDKVCNYLDMPLQHANDDILKRMKRYSTKKDALDIIDKARKLIPDIALRTTFIVGFPGETDENFEELMNFIQDMKFDRVGVFQYSHEEDTAAYDYEDDVPEEVKDYRAKMLMELQREISFKKNEKKIGKSFDVIIDSYDGEYYVGRTQYDSPEVDNEVLFTSESSLNIGQIVKVNINDVEDFDLYGEAES
ncbi:MAG: MiaB/RimO family radical SAM methylthiotransferase [Saprospiraceae bacterium]